MCMYNSRISFFPIIVFFMITMFFEAYLLHMKLYPPCLSFPPTPGAGGGLISNFEQLVRGVWKPETNELLKMS